MSHRGLIIELNKRAVLFVFFYFSTVYALKCRSASESPQGSDFEYVVRTCLRHMRNESDIYDLYRPQSEYDYNRNKRHREEISGDGNNNDDDDDDDDDRNYYSGNRGYSENFDRLWPSSSRHDRSRHETDDERNRQEGDYEDSDFFGLPRNGKEGRKKFKGRSQMPHSYQQQLQHDRDVLYNRGNRDSSYYYGNRNRNTKLIFNKNKNYDSPLTDIDPCVIHCIFKEMQMVDENGKPNKGMISQKMTQKIRSSELKNFIQESVDECFDVIDDDDDIAISHTGSNSNNNNNRYKRKETSCEWAKKFAMCLEDRGRENCDDWNDPLQKNHNNNNNNNNNSGNNKNEEQRHKSKQNDRG